MDVARIRTNDTCNLACGFCTERRPVETPAFITPLALKSRIDAAVKRGAKELVLTGGEPTLRKDLPDIVRYCVSLGRRVVLETNATKIDQSLAEKLRDAKLTVIRVHVPSLDERAFESVTTVPGSFATMRSGLDACLRAGLTVEIAAPLINETKSFLTAMPAALKKLEGKLSALVVGIPLTTPMDEAGRALEDLDTAARHAGLPLRLAGGTPLPPCQVEKPSRLAHLFTVTRGGASRPDCEKLEGCSTCVLNELCPGVPLNTVKHVTPLTDDRLRRRLSTASSTEEQIERELVTRDLRRRPDGVVRENIVRVNFRCNQACTFCFVSTHLPSAKEEAIEAGILETARLNGVVTLSGGEPTLNPRLLHYVELAKREGASEVELQTNATRIDRPLAEALSAAGLSQVFVSLHGSTAAISDEVTEAPGTFVKTLAGLDEVHRTTMKVRINFVFCRANGDDFPAFVELVTTRWPRASINVSFIAPSTDVVPRDVKLIPRYVDIAPSLAAGLTLAQQRKTVVEGFDSMCGLPLCLVPTEVSAQYAQFPAAPDSGGEFVKTDTCAKCSMDTQCFGLRRGYAELHGTGELRAIALQEPA